MKDKDKLGFFYESIHFSYCAVYPPSTVNVFPVIKEESSEAMNNTAFAISSALPRRCIGVIEASSFLLSSGIMGVSIKPGLKSSHEYFLVHILMQVSVLS